MGQVARKAAIATLVVLGIVVLALALWKLRVLVSLLFLGLVIAAAMRPGVEWLHDRRVPRAAGVAIHYLAIAGVIALFLWLVVPRAVRLFEDYIVVSRVLGHAVGLSPLVVLVSVTVIGLLLGGVYVLLAVPIAAVLVTLVDVIVRDKDPADQEVPTLLFPAKDAEGLWARDQESVAVRRREGTVPEGECPTNRSWAATA